MSAPLSGGQDRDQPPAGVLRRAALILDAVAARAGTHPGGLNLTQVVASTGLPQASVHRTLEQLVALGWLRRDGMEYRLGLRLAELGAAAVSDDELRLAALPRLRRLHQQTGCVVQLGVLDGDEVVFLERIGGESVPAIRTRVGSRTSARRSTIGAALLSPDASPSLAVPGTPRVRDQRLAYTRNGCLEGFACLAAPIGPQGRERAAAVSVFGAAARLDDRHVRQSLQSAAAAIWQRLNAPVAPPSPVGTIRA